MMFDIETRLKTSYGPLFIEARIERTRDGIGDHKEWRAVVIHSFSAWTIDGKSEEPLFTESTAPEPFWEELQALVENYLHDLDYWD